MTKLPEINYRTASVEDAEALARIHIEGWRSSYTNLVEQEYLDALDIEKRAAEWRQWFENGDFYVLLACAGDTTCGFISYGKLRTPVPGMSPIRPLYSAEIYGLYILPEYWRQGIGRELIRRACIDLREKRHRSLSLWVLKKNQRALAFYKALDGQRCGKKKIEIGNRTFEDVCFGWRDTTPLIKPDQPPC